MRWPLLNEIDYAQTGRMMYSMIEELYPICRSITGNGVRETLSHICKKLPITIERIPSGTKAFDWVVPREWNIRDAYIKDQSGRKIVDFKESNLHVVGYSIPVNKRLAFRELKDHLYTLPEHPGWIPYKTTYYKEDWGFCITYNQYKAMEAEDGVYEVVIDSSLEDGFLEYGELFIKGEREEEILLTCYICHPSLCNDNLSGISLMTALAEHLLRFDNLRYSYRFLFLPETIGSIVWLSRNEANLSKIRAGLVATCVGDPGKSRYKRSRRGDALIDRVVEKVLSDSGDEYEILDFFPTGSDERQFCSPGFNLPVGSLMRTPYGCFPEYHTSADNLDFIDAGSLADSLEKYLKAVFILEHEDYYVNLNPKCEPQLGKRGLYGTVGGGIDRAEEWALLWVLNFSDGEHSLLDISIRSKIRFEEILHAAEKLSNAGLLEKTTDLR